MAIARRRWSPDEKRTVLQLNKEGYTYRQIGEKLRPGVDNAWRSVGDIVKADRAKVVSNPITNVSGSGTTPYKLTPPPSKYQSRVELPEAMAHSLSAREFMTMMDDDQRSIFVATYEDLHGNVDEATLNKGENEMLIRAAYSNVKYLRAQSLLNLSESYLMLEMEGGMGDSDEDKAKKRFAGRGDAYKKEAEQWHKEYMELLNDLKMTRKQRLDKIKDTRNTFLDLQEELTTKLREGSIIEDIKRINMSTLDEFQRMAKGEPGPDGKVHPWLIGAFDEVLVNNHEELKNEIDKMVDKSAAEQQTKEGG